ncbi:MAG: 4'-phosphopantetheinyl transferase superfamily protein, partial [Clostridium sp.]
GSMGKDLGITRLYFMKVNSIEERFNHWYNSVSDYRRDKVMKLRVYEDRVRSLASEVVLRMGLRDVGYKFDDLTIEYSDRGKPDFTKESLHYNLSHSGDYVLCGLSKYPIGVDIEKVRSINLKIIDRFYSIDEGEYLKGFLGEDKLREFFRIWSCKESYIKYTGEGLAAPLKSFSVDLMNNTVTREEVLLNCRLHIFELDGHMASSCYIGEGVELKEIVLE